MKYESDSEKRSMKILGLLVPNVLCHGTQILGTLEGPMLNRFKRISILIICALVFTAQTLRADVTGSILGVVHDSSRAVVAGANIVATNVQTNFKQETISAADGSFRFLALPAGTYKLTATAAGFRQFTATGYRRKSKRPVAHSTSLSSGQRDRRNRVSPPMRCRSRPKARSWAT